MRRGLVGITVSLVFLQGCISVGNYASPSLVGRGAWAIGAGTPILWAMVDTGGVEMTAGFYPEVFVRYGVMENLEIEGRTVVIPSLTLRGVLGGAVGGGFRWAIVDTGFRATAGLSATYFSFVEDLTSPSTRWSTVALYPGLWLGTDRVYGAIRGLWLLLGAATPEGSQWVSGSSVLLTVGHHVRGRVFDAFPEITLALPLSGESPSMLITLGLGLAIHPERKAGR